MFLTGTGAQEVLDAAFEGRRCQGPEIAGRDAAVSTDEERLGYGVHTVRIRDEAVGVGDDDPVGALVAVEPLGPGQVIMDQHVHDDQGRVRGFMTGVGHEAEVLLAERVPRPAEMENEREPGQTLRGHDLAVLGAGRELRRDVAPLGRTSLVVAGPAEEERGGHDRRSGDGDGEEQIGAAPPWR